MLLLEISRSTKQKKFLIKERKKKWSRKLELEIMNAKVSRREIRFKKKKKKWKTEWKIRMTIFIGRWHKSTYRKPLKIYTKNLSTLVKFSKMANTRLQAKWVQRGYTSAQWRPPSASSQLTPHSTVKSWIFLQHKE